MEAHFCHIMNKIYMNKKMKKSYCDFLSHNSDFFLSYTVVSYTVRIVRKKVRIVSLYLAVLILFLRIATLSRNYDFSTRNCEFVSHNYEKKVRIVR